MHELVTRDNTDAVACMDTFGFFPVDLDTFLESRENIDLMDRMLSVLSCAGLASEKASKTTFPLLKNRDDWAALANTTQHQVTDDEGEVDPDFQAFRRVFIGKMESESRQRALKDSVAKSREREENEKKRRRMDIETHEAHEERKARSEKEVQELQDTIPPSEAHRPFYMPDPQNTNGIDLEGSNVVHPESDQAYDNYWDDDDADMQH